jgi:hypothetical protein
LHVAQAAVSLEVAASNGSRWACAPGGGKKGALAGRSTPAERLKQQVHGRYVLSARCRRSVVANSGSASGTHPTYEESPVKKFLILGIACLFLVGVSGCGTPADNLMKEKISLMNQMADALEKGDKAKAEEIDKKGKELEKKMEDLKLSDEEKKKLTEKYKDEITKAVARVLAAGMKAGM